MCTLEGVVLTRIIHEVALNRAYSIGEEGHGKLIRSLGWLEEIATRNYSSSPLLIIQRRIWSANLDGGRLVGCSMALRATETERIVGG